MNFSPGEFSFARRAALGATLLLLQASVGAAKECGQTQMEATACAGADFDRADAKMNVVFRKLAAKVTPGGRAKLVEAQRAWIKYRDAQCVFDTFGTRGGSINAQMHAQCSAQMTEAQTRRLERQLNCAEGDMSCGGQ